MEHGQRVKRLLTVFDKLQKKEFDALKDAQKVLYFLIEHNLPYLSLYEPLMKLCIDLGATNLQCLPQTKNATYKSAATAAEFLECQAEVVEKKVNKEIQRSWSYGLMIDVSARKHLALVCKYVDSGSSKLAFLQDVQLENGAAQTIYEAMKKHLDSASIPIDKMTSFASDGPAVMVGKKNEVIAHLKRDNDSVIHLHCLNHWLQLAVSKAFNSITIMSNTNELLTGLFKY